MQLDQPEQILNESLKNMIADPKSPLYADPNSPYYKNPQFAALVNKARLQCDELKKTEQSLDDLKKDESKLQANYQVAKDSLITKLSEIPVVLPPTTAITVRDKKTRSKKTYPTNKHTFYKSIDGRKAEKIPLLNTKMEEEFDCFKMLRKIFCC